MDNPSHAQFLAMIPTLTRDKLVKLYVKTRQAKSVAKAAFDEQEAQFKQIMETCENVMLASCDATGDTGFTTPYGTTYQSETLKVSIGDDTAFFAFVKAQNDLDFLERRVSSTHVQNYMKAHDGAVPPGLNVFRERVVRVRKATEKSTE